MAGTVHPKAYGALFAALIAARKQAGFSQACLAQKLRRPPSLVGKYDLGERRLDVVELMSILR